MTHETSWRRAFRAILAEEAGRNPDASAIAAAGQRLCEHLARRLSPLVGEAGVAAICARGLHLARQDFPWLSAAHGPDGSDGGEVFGTLERSLAQQEPAAAADAVVVILSTSATLFASLIGEGLTTRLLHETWPGQFPIDSTQERS